ncbi:MAG: hypothetical protein LBJ67_03530 [Planctomycetaceae bacterium]|jgi:TPR repeat protein|nr:hypothetical protein [Planctomycetaceae bacterium]
MKTQKRYFAEALLFCIVSLFFYVECRLCESATPSLKEVLQANKDGKFREIVAENPEVVKKTFYLDNKLSATLLHIAAYAKDTEFVKTLLELGANPAAKDSDNYIPLVHAVLQQKGIEAEEVIRYLVANCSDNNPLESCFELLKSCLAPPENIKNNIDMIAGTLSGNTSFSETAQVQMQQIYGERSKVVQKCILTMKVATEDVDLKKYNVKNFPKNTEKQKENKKEKEKEIEKPTSEKIESKDNKKTVSDAGVSEEDFLQMKEKAENGDTDAQAALGLYYSHKKDFDNTFKWFRKATENGNAKSLLGLAGCYLYGLGVTQDQTEGIKLLLKAAESGSPEAQFVLATFYFNGTIVSKDQVEAAKWLRKAAENGLSQAQLLLGTGLLDGTFSTKDTAEAVKWLQKAANQNDSVAQLLLAKYYLQRRDVTKNNEEKGMKLLLKSAEQGNLDAQHILGVNYIVGQYIEENFEEGIKWLKKAAEQGHVLAQSSLGLALFHRDKYDEAIKWLRKSAEQGDAESQYTLGLCYGAGKGVTRDEPEAIKWINKAAEQGHQGAIKIMNDKKKAQLGL